MNSKFLLLTLSLLVLGCAHKEVIVDVPAAWLSGGPRTVANDRIFFRASAENKSLDRARGEAEASAFEDIANECSFVPSATKNENEYTNMKGAAHTVSTQLSVSKADCAKAQSTLAPDEIRNAASLSATQKILKHQDLVGESNEPSNGVQDPVRSGDVQGLINARQQIALMKQAVILAGSNHYRLHSLESKRFYQKIKSASDPLTSLNKQTNAQTMESSWSSTHQRESVAVPVPVLSTDLPAPDSTAGLSAPSSPRATPASGKHKGPKATPKSFPKN